MNKKTYSLMAIITTVLLLLLLGGFYFLQMTSDALSDYFEQVVVVNLRSEPTQPPLTVTTISRCELEQDYWNVFIDGIILDENADYIVGSLDKSEPVHLLSIDAITRKINWEMPGRMPFVAGGKYVYITGNEPGTVTAYEKGHGEKIWESNVDNQYKVISRLEITPLGLLVTAASHGYERYHLLNLETGEPIVTFKSDASKEEYFIENRSQIYMLEYFATVTAAGNNQWQTYAGFEDDPYNRWFPQILIEENVVIVYQKGYPFTQVAILDNTSGEHIWHTTVQSKSNLAFYGDELFYVSNDTKLYGGRLDAQQWTHYATFLPEVLEEPGENTDIIVKAHKERVLIYFTGNQQLVVLRCLSNE
jgi:outer membrane protein assembly factor BamB